MITAQIRDRIALPAQYRDKIAEREFRFRAHRMEAWKSLWLV